MTVEAADRKGRLARCLVWAAVATAAGTWLWNKRRERPLLERTRARLRRSPMQAVATPQAPPPYAGPDGG